MLELLKLILFTKLLLLTPDPVSFESEQTIHLKEPIGAINSKGHIEIDVTLMMPNALQGKLNKELNLLSEKFPEKCMTARLVNSKTGDDVLLSRVSYATNEDQLLIYIMSESGVPTDLEFDEVHIQTSVSLDKVSVYWKNGVM